MTMRLDLPVVLSLVLLALCLQVDAGQPVYPPTPPANVRCFECDLSVGRGVSALDFRNTVSGGFIAPVSLSEKLSVENNRNLTIEMWLRTDHIGQVGKFQALAARYSRAPGPRGNIFVDFVLQTTPQGTISFFMGGGGPSKSVALNKVCKTPFLVDKNWHHVAFVMFTKDFIVNPDQVMVYVDSELYCQWGPGERFWGIRQFLTTDPISFSNYENPQGRGLPYYWDGEMDEVKVWDFARTQEEIAESYLLPAKGDEPGLLAYYKLDQTGTPGNALGVWDDSPYNNTGALIGYEQTVPTYIGSSVPLKNIVYVNNFADPVPITFYAINAPDTDQAVVVLVNTGNIYDQFFLDAAGTKPYVPTDFVPSPQAEKFTLAEGQPVPQAQLWFRSSSFVDEVLYVQYFSASRDAVGQYVVSKDELDNPGFATVEIHVTAIGCDGKGTPINYCGLCGNPEFLCPPLGCDGKGGYYDTCGNCNPVGTVAVLECPIGCDGVGFSAVNYDNCGVCGGDNDCLSGCDNRPFSTLVYDRCGICGGNDACVGCDNVTFSGLTFDVCHECGGNGTSCLSGCNDAPFSDLTFDECGRCGGDNLSCACSLSEWRGYDQDDFDRLLLSVDLLKLKNDIDVLRANVTALVADLRTGSSPTRSEFSCHDFTLAFEQLEAFSLATDSFASDSEDFIRELVPPSLPCV